MVRHYGVKHTDRLLKGVGHAGRFDGFPAPADAAGAVRAKFCVGHWKLL